MCLNMGDLITIVFVKEEEDVLIDIDVQSDSSMGKRDRRSGKFQAWTREIW